MRLLVVNPNISTSVTALIEAEARRAASPDTALSFATAAFGVAYIETRFEALVGGYATACAAAEHAGTFDGLVVAAFGDPGLGGLKELFDVPVIGMTEAALASACLLGARFSIIAISHRIQAWYRECVEANGLASRLASIRSLTSPLRDIATVQEDHAERLIALSRQAVDEDGADVIVVAGAPLAGLARTLRNRIPVPVVDGVSSAVRHCESLVALQPGAAMQGSFQRPPSKPNAGMPPALGRLLRAPE
ncbi:aspartate/glutamate racemase family protein [Pandoraea pnomenusa]|uniref:Asp/Glu/hydantoin racemase n=1 Tax=Pandoraea pnomenusa TaxID=93220 RepID=A0ABY6WL58_9BURK|nr:MULTISPECIES: aspartate/glutamate racemase family protein [Pandoraea]AHB77058.1 Asp/Glu/hydantoin racemase [Pandoraea pnomenusa]AHN74576.1 Asp/Glu/hydantoin racemase [Pandoraea pnomenusa]ANC45845.1 Asp/Glu/hydantoin racemase [Pandoraea pnomenusa]MBN9092255.1 aspartate/glutamate racemase family protein [Pandoraea pnomenusa]QDH59006.1 Asp/Glu/hydantoin racemase [Pandoraea pnomenusa]